MARIKVTGYLWTEELDEFALDPETDTGLTENAYNTLILGQDAGALSMAALHDVTVQQLAT